MDPQDYSSIEVEIKNKPLAEILSQFDPYEYDYEEYVFHVEDESLFYYRDEGGFMIKPDSEGILSDIVFRIIEYFEEQSEYVELDLDENQLYQSLKNLDLDSIFSMTERIESTYSIRTPLSYLFNAMGSSYISQEDVKKKSAETGINIDFAEDWILYTENYVYDQSKSIEKFITSVDQMHFEILNRKI